MRVQVRQLTGQSLIWAATHSLLIKEGVGKMCDRAEELDSTWYAYACDSGISNEIMFSHVASMYSHSFNEDSSELFARLIKVHQITAAAWKGASEPWSAKSPILGHVVFGSSESEAALRCAAMISNPSGWVEVPDDFLPKITLRTDAWGDAHKNPFMAIHNLIQKQGDPEDWVKAQEILANSMLWDNFSDPKEYLDDVLQEIAGATNIVFSYLSNDTYRAKYDMESEVTQPVRERATA